MGNKIRTFIASELPREIIDFASNLQNRFKQQGMVLKWVRPHNMHLTLKFLGDIDPDRKSQILDAIQMVGAHHPPLELKIQGMGVFPGIRKPRVLWIGLGGQTDLLAQMHAYLEQVLETAGFEKEHRRFNAHLTIARINKPLDSGRLLDILQGEGSYAPVSFVLNELVLFKSDLRPQGALYTPLGKAALKSASLKKDV